MKNVFILFGEMGSGKNFWGERLAKLNNYVFYDGDLAAPPEMIEKVINFQPLTREIIASFTQALTKKVLEQADQHPGLVVAQALYFDQDRIQLRHVLEKHGYHVRFYWVHTGFWRNLKQIFSRPRGWKWVIYWLLNKPYFEVPTHGCFEIRNKFMIKSLSA